MMVIWGTGNRPPQIRAHQEDIVTDAIPEPDLEERSLDLREREVGSLPDNIDATDATDRLHELDSVPGRTTLPDLRDDVSEADAIDQATPVGYDDEDDWRG